MTNNINYIYNKNKLINPLITGNNAILFELLEIIIILFLILYYSNKNYILSIIFIIPFIEHIRQIIYKYRQAPNSTIDKITLIFEFGIFIYSIYYKYLISSIASLIGFLIHLFQIISKRNWIDIVSYNDILKLI
jgi:hypothetical protein